MSEEGEKKKIGRPRKYPRNSMASDSYPRERHLIYEVSYTVAPEERDYYYNLDFLCGTYHGHHNRFKDQVGPCHALGYGKDE